MTLLTPEEILEVSWGEPDYLALTAENIAAGLDAVACAQLRKVIAELEDISNSEDDLVEFDRRLTYWLEAARKEIGNANTERTKVNCISSSLLKAELLSKS